MTKEVLLLGCVSIPGRFLIGSEGLVIDKIDFG